MHTLIFISTLRCDRIEDVADNLSSARNYRSQVGNTGLTLLAGGNMLVLIQGTQEGVEKEFALAKKHTTFHQNVIQLLKTKNQYLFSDSYPLLFKPLFTPSMSSLNDFAETALANRFDEFLNQSCEASIIVNTFIKYNR